MCEIVTETQWHYNRSHGKHKNLEWTIMAAILGTYKNIWHLDAFKLLYADLWISVCAI